MKFIKINAGGVAEVVELKGQDTIDYIKMKELLGFDSPVTVVERKINGQYYDLWCDDEGLLKEEEKRIVGAVLMDKRPGVSEYLIGNILILTHDEEGNSTGLTDDQIADIMYGFCLIHMDDLCEYKGWDKEQDKKIYGYFDNGSLTIKAHSQFLTYKV